MLTLQEVFNKVYRHLLTQNRVARNSLAGICRYRSKPHDDDSVVLMCAAGVLIDDEHYSESIEGYHVLNATAPRSALIKSGVDMNDPVMNALVASLQDVHDAGDPSEWPDELYRVAGMFKLEVPA